jgi:hypothetical protein
MSNPNGKVENLTPFKPGQSGNPGGIPNGKPITSAMHKLLQLPVEELRALLNDPLAFEKMPTYEAIALQQIRSAVIGKDSSTDRILDRTEGKAVETHLIYGEDKINSMDQALKELLGIQNAQDNEGDGSGA